MSAYSVIARWLYNEASSGTTPTTVADDTGNGNDLTPDYGSGDANWASVAAGNGLDFTADPITGSAVAELVDIATNGTIGSSLSGVNELSFITICDIDEGHSFGPRLSQIGTAGGDGDFAILTRAAPATEDFLFRWNQEASGSDMSYPIPNGGYPTGLVIIHVIIDTTQATAIDRIKVYYDGVLQVANSGTIVQNSTIDPDQTNRYFTSGNRGTQNRSIKGVNYYEEIGNGQFTPTQVSDSYTALLADNDADWNAGAGSTLTADSGSYAYTGTASDLKTDLILAANSGSYLYSGQDAGLFAGVVLGAESGSYSYSGTAAGLISARVLAADSGSYSYTGQDAGLIRSYALALDSGSYVYSGTATDLIFEAPGDFTLVANSAAYSYSGSAAEITQDRVLAAASGTYTYAGDDVGLFVGFDLDADSGNYVYTGSPADLLSDAKLAASTGSYLYTGSDAALAFSGAEVLSFAVFGFIDETGNSSKSVISSAGATVSGTIVDLLAVSAIISSDGQSVKSKIDSKGEAVSGPF
jgi:hypothetical protein